MNQIRKIGALVIIAVFMIQALAFAAERFSTHTTLSDKGKKWRIGYFEGGEDTSYQQNLIMTIKGLMELGWIEPAHIPPQQGVQTKKLWHWVATQAKSRYLQFVQDAYYTANWDENLRDTMSVAIIRRLNNQKDIDLMFAMGTWAGLALANNQHHVNTMVMGTADPLKSGIIKSIEDSGYDHVHARIDPSRFERQVRVFHDIINFKKLGLVYENTPVGRTYSAVDEVEKIAKLRGFEIVRCFAPSDVAADVAAREVERCFQELVQKVDAIYVPVHGGITPKTIPRLAEIANFHGIPTFSLSGGDEVKAGFLMSLSMAGYKYAGQFYAKTMAQIFNGAKPRQLPQVFEDPARIAINLKTAQIIKYNAPLDIIGTADEVYSEIEPPKN